MNQHTKTALIFCPHHQASKKLTRLTKECNFTPIVAKETECVETLTQEHQPQLIILRDTKSHSADLSKEHCSFFEPSSKIPILWILEHDSITAIPEIIRNTLNIDYLEFSFSDQEFINAVTLLTREEISAEILTVMPSAYNGVIQFLDELPLKLQATKKCIENTQRESLKNLMNELHGSATFLGYSEFATVAHTFLREITIAGRTELFGYHAQLLHLANAMMNGRPDEALSHDQNTQFDQKHLYSEISQALDALERFIQDGQWENGLEKFHHLCSLVSTSHLHHGSLQMVTLEMLLSLKKKDAIHYTIKNTKQLLSTESQETPEVDIISTELSSFELVEQFELYLQKMKRSLNRFDWQEVAHIAIEATQCAENLGNSDLAEQCMILDIYSEMESFEDTEEQLNAIQTTFNALDIS